MCPQKECFESNCERNVSFEGCYDIEDKGESYDGEVYYDIEGNECDMWANYGYAEIAGNVCRNPEGIREQPWCFVDGHEHDCDIPTCGKTHYLMQATDKRSLVSHYVYG